MPLEEPCIIDCEIIKLFETACKNNNIKIATKIANDYPEYFWFSVYKNNINKFSSIIV